MSFLAELMARIHKADPNTDLLIKEHTGTTPPFKVGDWVTWHSFVQPVLQSRLGNGPFRVTEVFSHCPRDSESTLPVWMIRIESADGKPVHFVDPSKVSAEVRAEPERYRDFLAYNFVPAQQPN